MQHIYAISPMKSVLKSDISIELRATIVFTLT